MNEFISSRFLIIILQFLSIGAIENNHIQYISFEKQSTHGNHIIGENYIRPTGSSNLAGVKSRHLNRFSSNSESTDTSLVPENVVNGINNVNDYTACASQIHITLGNNANEYFISFTSSNKSIPGILISKASISDFSSNSETKFVPATAVVYSQLVSVASRLYNPTIGAIGEPSSFVVSLQNTSGWAFSTINGTQVEWGNYNNPTSNTPVQGLSAYNNPLLVYDSPYVYTAIVPELQEDTLYSYQIMDECSQVISFKTMMESSGALGDYPFKIGITVDLGQTVVSNVSIQALIAMDPDVVILSGDLSYADGWYPRWDSFGNLLEPLASKIPVLTTGGNHEFGGSEAWLSYSSRYPTPHRGSGSSHFCYYGKEVGVVHVIALCSYAGFTNSSIQYSWLSEYLSTSINRTKTPWVIVMMHVPWYNSNTGHVMEGELMRQSMEGILYSYGVDIVVVGHVHVYERTYAVYDNEINPCGPIHMTVGDGGNYEGVYTPWMTPRPSWSAFREASFGIAGIEFLNETVAMFSWHRHACQSDSGDGNSYHVNFTDSCVSPDDNGGYSMLTTDETYITRPSISECPNRYISTATDAIISNPSISEIDDSDSGTFPASVVIGLSLAVGILGILVLVLAAIIIRMKDKLQPTSTGMSRNGVGSINNPILDSSHDPESVVSVNPS